MYETLEIRSIQEVKELFPNKVASESRWLLCSTGGIHGSETTINDCEYIVRGEDKDIDPLPNGKTYITVLIVEPKNCILRWGEIQVNLEDLSYLRNLIRSSIQKIGLSQGGNLI